MSGRPDLLQDLNRPLVSGNGRHAVKKRTAQKVIEARENSPSLLSVSFSLSRPFYFVPFLSFCPSFFSCFFVLFCFVLFCFCPLSVSPTPHCMPERLKQASILVLIRKCNQRLISLSSNNPLGHNDIFLLCLFRILLVSNLVAYLEELINRNGMQKLRYLLSGDSVKWIIERKNTL